MKAIIKEFMKPIVFVLESLEKGKKERKWVNKANIVISCASIIRLKTSGAPEYWLTIA